MAEKVVRLGIARERGFLYFLRGSEVWRTPMKRPGERVPPAAPELVSADAFVREDGWLYFLDAQGDVSRAARTVSPTRVEPVAGEPPDLSMGWEILSQRRADGDGPVEPYLRFAERLAADGHAPRAEFIRRQCAGEDAADLSRAIAAPGASPTSPRT